MAIVFNRSNKFLEAGATGAVAFTRAQRAKAERKLIDQQRELAKERLAQIQTQAAWDKEDRPRALAEHAEDRAFQAKQRDRAGQAADIDLNMKSLQAERTVRGMDDAQSAIGSLADNLEAAADEYKDAPPELLEGHRQRVAMLRQFTDPTAAKLSADEWEMALHKQMAPFARQRLAEEIGQTLSDGDLPDEAVDERLRALREKLADKNSNMDPREARKLYEGLSDSYIEAQSRVHTKERVSNEVLALIDHADPTSGPLNESQKQKLTDIAARVRGGRLDPTEGRALADRVRFGLSERDDEDAMRLKLEDLATKRYGKALETGLIDLDEFDRRVDAFVESRMSASSRGGGGRTVDTTGRTVGGGGAAGGAGGGQSLPQLRAQNPEAYQQAISEIGSLRASKAPRAAFEELGAKLGVDIQTLDDQGRQDVMQSATNSWLPKGIAPGSWPAPEGQQPGGPQPVAPSGGPGGPPAAGAAPAPRERTSRFITPQTRTKKGPGVVVGGDSQDDAAEIVREMAKAQAARVKGLLTKGDVNTTAIKRAGDGPAADNLTKSMRGKEVQSAREIEAAQRDLEQAVQEYTDNWGELPDDLAELVESAGL